MSIFINILIGLMTCMELTYSIINHVFYSMLCPYSCNASCSAGQYGVNCNQTCSCYDNDCDPVSGKRNLSKCTFPLLIPIILMHYLEWSLPTLGPPERNQRMGLVAAGLLFCLLLLLLLSLLCWGLLCRHVYIDR